MFSKKLGYARVSMCSRDLGLQLDALKIAGVEDADISAAGLERPPGSAASYSTAAQSCLGKSKKCS
jgi:hypothetical protein